MSYRKDDVQVSYHQGTRGLPMANVKVHGYVTDAICARVAEDNGDHEAARFGFSADWIERHDPEGHWWWAAAEDERDYLNDLAREVFGDHVRVWFMGRSGGWAVVEGLDDVETWDAVALSKWRKFERWAEGVAKDHPYAYASLMYLNLWESEREDLNSGDPLFLATFG